jgi:hypothetical protein
MHGLILYENRSHYYSPVAAVAAARARTESVAVERRRHGISY